MSVTIWERFECLEYGWGNLQPKYHVIIQWHPEYTTGGTTLCNGVYIIIIFNCDFVPPKRSRKACDLN